MPLSLFKSRRTALLPFSAVLWSTLVRLGFAKLIELPDDVSAKYGNDFSSDFWPTVLKNGASFQYGEVLQEGGNIFYSSDMKSGYDDSLSSRLAAYHKYMKTTNSLYG